MTVPACAAGPTRRALAQLRRRAALLAVAGTACLVGFVAVVDAVATDNEALREDGVRTTGSIVQLYPDTSGESGYGVVRYLADGVPSQSRVELGALTDDYTEGQAVTVWYDPTEPEHITIGDVDNEPAGTTWLTIGLLLCGLGFPVAALVSVVRRRRLARVLATGPWEPVRVSVPHTRVSSQFTTADGAIWRTRGGDPWPTPNRQPRRLAGWGLPDEDPATVPTDQPAWWVRDGDRAVFSLDQARPLALTRRQLISQAPTEVADGEGRSSSPGRRVLGRWSSVTLGALGAAVAAAFGFAWWNVLSYPGGSVGEVLNPAAPLALMVAFFVLTASCRVVGDPAGHIEVVGLLLVRRIPVTAISRVTATSGLRIVLHSGREVGSWAHGQSLLGDWLGYPRSVASAARISDFVRSCAPPSEDQEFREVTTDLAVKELLVAVLAGALLVAGALLLDEL